MKKVGIIGGAGPLASSLLYESVVRECYRQRAAVPEMVILNFPFTRCLTQGEEAENLNRVLGELSYCIEALQKHEVDVGVVACNTLHLLLKMLPEPGIPFQALPELVLAEAKRSGARRLLILGSENTCRMGLYCDPDLTMVYPEQNIIDAIIDRVLQGIIAEEDSIALSHLLSTAQVDGVVLGCTELPVLHHHYPIASPVPLYDSIKITAKTIRGAL